MIRVETYTADGQYAGMLDVFFSSPMRYYITSCVTNSRADLPVQPPDVLDKTWTILKTNTTLNIKCNGVEVLNYQFSDSSYRNDCVTRWGRDVVKQIRFESSDTASDSYQKEKEGIYNNYLR